MVIHTRAGWHYDLNVSQTASGQYGWVVVRYRAGVNVASGQPLASGLADARGKAMEEAERALERFLEETNTGGDRMRR